METSSVESHHVNVDIGDCAVHILCESDAASGKTVKSAVLIDGGTSSPSDNAPRNIINKLTVLYKLSKKLTLQTIIVTHWDEDHYGGLRDLISQDMKKAIKDGLSPSKGLDYLLWDPANGTPQTYFYCPNENVTKLLKKGLAGGFRRGTKPNEQYIEVCVSEEPQGEIWKPFAILRSADNDVYTVLGVNFFSNNKLSSRPGAITPAGLLRLHNLEPGTPGMFCIGVKYQTFGVEPPKIIRESGSETNQSSIAAAILWAPQVSDTKPVKCSHYFAGDADDDREKRYLGWLGQSDAQSEKDKVTQISNIKLSHHGSRTSTPLPIVNFKPKNIVVSNPKGRYIHPGWEVIFFLSIYCRMEGRNNGATPRIFGTRYPFYLVIDKDENYIVTKPVLNIKAFNENYGPAAEFINYIKDAHEKLKGWSPAGTDKRSELGEYEQAASNGKRKALLDMARVKWNDLGWPTVKNHNDASSSTSRPEAQTMTPSAIPECVTVRSALESETENRVTYMVANCYEQIPTSEPVAKSAKRSAEVVEAGETQNFLNDDQACSSLSMPKRMKTCDIDEELEPATVVKKDDFVTEEGTNPDEMDFDNQPTEFDSESADISVRTSRQRGVPNVGEPLMPLPPGLPPDDSNWYLFGSIITQTAIQAVVQNQRYTRIAETSSWDGFVSTLHCAMFGLSQDPSTFDQGNSIKLNERDELSCWFQDIFDTDPTNIQMIRGEKPEEGFIGGFAISMPLVPPQDLQKGDSLVMLLFTTETSALENTFAGSEPPNTGLRDGATALTMALKGLDNPSNDTQKVTLDTISQFVGLGALFDGGVLYTFKTLCFTIPDSQQNPGQGHRNALWFVPQQGYATTVRLQLDIFSDDLKSLQTLLSILNGTVKSASIIARRKSSWMSNTETIFSQTRGQLVLLTEMDIKGLTFDVIANLQQEILQFDFILKKKDGSVLDDILNWLKDSFITSSVDKADATDDPFPFKTWLKGVAGPISFPTFDFRRVVITFSQPTSDSSRLQFCSFSLDMEMQIKVKDQIVLSLVNFTYHPKAVGKLSLEAQLWTAPSYNVTDPALRLTPDFEDYAWFEPLDLGGDLSEWPEALDLKKLTGFGDSTPSIFPTLLRMAKLYIDGEKVAFTGALSCADPAESGQGPPIFAINVIQLAASYNFGDSNIDCTLAMSASIQAPPESDLQPAELKGSFTYSEQNQRWVLSGSIENLYGAHFYQFFDPDMRLSAASLLESIAVKNFNITYIYTNGKPSSFAVGGTLEIGNLDFTLAYHHEGAGDWEFDASIQLSTQQETTTLDDMLVSVIGENKFTLPDFLKNIVIYSKTSNDIVTLKLSPDEDKKNLFFTMSVKLGGLRIQYIQFAPLQEQPGETTPPPVQRVLLASIDALPSINIPILGDVTQPFDEALAMWVQAKSDSDGLTLEEVEMINDLITKPPLSQKPLPQKPEKGLQSGVHLMLVLKDQKGGTNVVVDYVFGGKKPNSPNVEGRAEEGSSDNGESGMAAYSKSYGGLSVRNLGLQYAGSTLSIKIDASIKFGPIDFGLVGFAIHLNFPAGTKFSLFDLPPPSVSIEGLEASYNSPPVTAKGILAHTSTESEDLWQGGLVGSFEPWTFAVAGCYGTITGLENFKTVFMYAHLLGPLITLEFATITGVTAGFGYNSSMQLPAVSDIARYPLLSVPSSPPDAPTAIQQLVRTPWFQGKNGSFWIAAGLEVNAFHILDVSAVLAIEFDPNVKLGLFAIGTAAIPDSAPGEFKFAQVQLALAAVIDFAAGTLKIDGQLTPASFILDPNCHLTGGFGLYSWFGDAAPDLKGDWVFTVGGYHRQFHAPPQYPNPPRLGISWQFSNSISIRGEAYFAITPKVCMGGGRWDVSLRLGPLEAWFSAYIDFLVSFKPFYFIADGGVSVGIRFTLDLWLVTIRISVELSARLSIQGPPIHGYVHVDFWVFGFDIAFGKSSGKPDVLSLSDFIDLACQAKGSTAVDMFDTILASTRVSGQRQGRVIGDQKGVESKDAESKAHVLVVQSGLVADGMPESRPSGDPWTVRAGTFGFAISCKVAISKATIITGKLEANALDDEADSVSEVKGTGNPIYARPMGISSEISTELHVTIRPVASKLKLLADGTSVEAQIPEWNNNSGIVKNLPAGLWGKYDPRTDPRNNANASSLLEGNTGGTVLLLCGVVIKAPKDFVARADTTKPFDFKKFMVQQVPPCPFARLLPSEAEFGPAPAEGEKQWESVKNAWRSPGMGNDAPKDVVQMWQEMGLSDVGWEPSKVGEMSMDANMPNTSLEPSLSGQIPEQLLLDFEDFYLWAPFLSAARS